MRRPDLFLAACAALASAGTAVAGESKSETGLSQSARVQINLAQSYLAKGDAANARVRIERALRTDPKAPEVYAVLGIVHDRLGEQEKATAAFARAIKLGPANATVFNAYAVWLCEHQRFAEAEQAFATALADAEYRATGQPLYNAGRCALKADKPQQADDYLREIVQRSPNDGPALFALAEANLASGNLLDARAFMQRRDALGSHPDVLRLGIKIEQAAGDARAAALYQKRLNDEFPDHPAPNGEGAGRP